MNNCLWKVSSIFTRKCFGEGQKVRIYFVIGMGKDDLIILAQ